MSGWVDPDDAPMLTKEFFERAEFASVARWCGRRRELSPKTSASPVARLSVKKPKSISASGLIAKLSPGFGRKVPAGKRG